MGRGGARVGSGRKPKGEKPRARVLGLDGQRLNPAQTAAAAASESSSVDVDLMSPPKDLAPDQKKLWSLYAPFAIEQRTLVAATVAGFRELCEQMAFKDAIAKEIRRRKPQTKDAESLLRSYVKLVQRVDSTLARFKLTSMGKPVEVAGGARKPKSNPWAQVGAR